VNDRIVIEKNVMVLKLPALSAQLAAAGRACLEADVVMVCPGIATTTEPTMHSSLPG
jgi:hypothetical protein